MNATPAVMNARARPRPGDIGIAPAATCPMYPATSEMFVVPVIPQTNARPNRKIALENDPSRKYLIAPSVLNPSFLW